MTTNGLPGGPGTQSPNVPANIVDFINQDMPAPSDAQRDAALAMPTYDGPLPTQDVQAPAAPTQTPVPAPQQPDIQPPQPQQPIPPQADPQQPAPVQPAPVQPDYQKQIADQNTELQQYKARETAWEQQRQEVETQRVATQEQAVQTGAKQYAMQEYQKYLAAGVDDSTAQQWAKNSASSMYNAYNFAANQQQAQTQAQAIATRYGVNASDIPQGMDSQAMEQFASMKSQLNQVQAQSQTISTNQIKQQTFDSNQGSAVGSPAQQFMQRMGDSTRLASRQDMASHMKWLQDNQIA